MFHSFRNPKCYLQQTLVRDMKQGIIRMIKQYMIEDRQWSRNQKGHHSINRQGNRLVENSRQINHSKTQLLIKKQISFKSLVGCNKSLTHVLTLNQITNFKMKMISKMKKMSSETRRTKRTKLKIQVFSEESLVVEIIQQVTLILTASQRLRI